MLAAVAKIAAAELAARAVKRRRTHARPAADAPGPQPTLTCRECGHGLWWGRPPRCSNPRCSVGRANRDAADVRQARQREVRLAPRPPYERVAGACSLCGDPVVAPRRSWCGPGCVDRWALATTPRLQRKALAAIFDGCWECRRPRSDGIRLDVDHRRPLWSLTAKERLNLTWWELPNLQLLCSGPDSCHARKTAREAAERARRRAAR